MNKEKEKKISKLEQWRTINGVSWKWMASKIGINALSLKTINDKGSPNVKVKTCLAIRKLTNLEPEEYLNGLEDYVILKNKK